MTEDETNQWDGANRRQKSFWNGSATKVLMALVGLLAFLGSHLYREMWDIPKTYAEKVEVSVLAEKMDQGFGELRAGIAEINRFLRDAHKP